MGGRGVLRGSYVLVAMVQDASNVCQTGARVMEDDSFCGTTGRRVGEEMQVADPVDRCWYCEVVWVWVDACL